MGLLRHFYGFCHNIDLSLWEKHQPGHRTENALNARVSQVKQPSGIRMNEKDMNSLTLKRIGVESGAKDRVAQAVRPRKLTKIYSVGAIIGLFGGAAASLFGSILTGASWLIADGRIRQLLSVTGSGLLFMTIPLIVSGACCLDWMEKDEPGIGAKTARPEYERDDDQ
jgi:hypothetical protein